MKPAGAHFPLRFFGRSRTPGTPFVIRELNTLRLNAAFTMVKGTAADARYLCAGLNTFDRADLLTTDHFAAPFFSSAVLGYRSATWPSHRLSK
jgi:hypothetical protein